MRRSDEIEKLPTERERGMREKERDGIHSHYRLYINIGLKSYIIYREWMRKGVVGRRSLEGVQGGGEGARRG